MTFPPAPPYGYGYPPPPPRPGVIPLAPLTLGAILSGTFSAFGRHWKQLYNASSDCQQCLLGSGIQFCGYGEFQHGESLHCRITGDSAAAAESEHQLRNDSVP